MELSVAVSANSAPVSSRPASSTSRRRRQPCLPMTSGISAAGHRSSDAVIRGGQGARRPAGAGGACRRRPARPRDGRHAGSPRPTEELYDIRGARQRPSRRTRLAHRQPPSGGGDPRTASSSCATMSSRRCWKGWARRSTATSFEPFSPFGGAYPGHGHSHDHDHHEHGHHHGHDRTIMGTITIMGTTMTHASGLPGDPHYGHRPWLIGRRRPAADCRLMAFGCRRPSRSAASPTATGSSAPSHDGCSPAPTPSGMAGRRSSPSARAGTTPCCLPKPGGVPRTAATFAISPNLAEALAGSRGASSRNDAAGRRLHRGRPGWPHPVLERLPEPTAPIASLSAPIARRPRCSAGGRARRLPAGLRRRTSSRRRIRLGVTGQTGRVGTHRRAGADDPGRRPPRRRNSTLDDLGSATILSDVAADEARDAIFEAFPLMMALAAVRSRAFRHRRPACLLGRRRRLAGRSTRDSAPAPSPVLPASTAMPSPAPASPVAAALCFLQPSWRSCWAGRRQPFPFFILGRGARHYPGFSRPRHCRLHAGLAPASPRISPSPGSTALFYSPLCLLSARDFSRSASEDFPHEIAERTASRRHRRPGRLGQDDADRKALQGAARRVLDRGRHQRHLHQGGRA